MEQDTFILYLTVVNGEITYEYIDSDDVSLLTADHSNIGKLRYSWIFTDSTKNYHYKVVVRRSVNWGQIYGSIYKNPNTWSFHKVINCIKDSKSFSNISVIAFTDENVIIPISMKPDDFIVTLLTKFHSKRVKDWVKRYNDNKYE